MELYDIFNALQIDYEQIEHEAVFTVAEAQRIEEKISGTGSKNLFLVNKKGACYLVILEEHARADLKAIARQANSGRLSFGSEEMLRQVMGLERGSVTPFGIIHDTEGRVIILIDKALQGRRLLFHPNRNTATVSISWEGLLRFIAHQGHAYQLLAVE